MHEHQDKIDALLLDNRFIDWVLNPQSPYAGYWMEWIAAHPEHAAIAEEAKALLLEMRREEDVAQATVSDEQVAQMLEHIRTGIARPRPLRRFWAAAAAVLALATITTIFFQLTGDRRMQPDVKKAKQTAEVVRYNGNQENELLFLPDGSKVSLSKGARISYNLLMDGNKREITLSGDAFFDVAKDPQKPFYIYTENVVVKVLGTSFRVTAAEGNETVAVKTGKVSVYLKGQDLEQSGAKIVLPQQICRHVQGTRELITEVYNGKHFPDKDPEALQNISFEDAPLATVLKTLEKMYAVPVRFNPETFNNCYITISLGNESLEEILKVITRTVDASYSMSTYGIIVEGKGCK